MSAQPRRVSKPEVWTRWEGTVVKGMFPLRRFLGSSEQGAVFLSEYNTGKASDVVIKLVPAIATQADMQLAQWRAAVALAHPNLVRLFDMGRCQLGGREFLFVVMEYGEQTLAEFLAQRTLAADEVRALMLPTLDALEFLHGKQLVHARLKPSNFLVVGDQLKLSSDGVRPAGLAGFGGPRSSFYEPPEIKDDGLGTAGDIWSLGVTLIESFTQRTPALTDEQYESGSLLANVPAQFVNTVRRCLNPTPASRPAVSELQAQFKSGPQADVTSEDRSHAHPLLLAMPATLLVLFLVLMGKSPSGKPQANVQSAAVPAPAPASSSAPARATAATTARPARTNPEPSSPVVEDGASPVVLEVKPDVPRAVSDKIQGRILVKVRVLVDSSGTVMAAMIETAGPNSSLANLADEAARQWKFAPAESQNTRVWILTFAFTREDVTARATAV